MIWSLDHKRWPQHLDIDIRMKKEIGKWFLDIAKYIVTAVVLKELFGGFEEKSIVITVATLTALFAFISGIIILRSVDKNDENHKVDLKETIVKSGNKESINNNVSLAEAKSKQTSNKKKGHKKWMEQ